ncbi:hypothetical protein RRG08_037068 [Elysia crispata]|uniref:Uncharacterized protein n=1 Tax=Elysia crispata TaxID=231223 RepID=A0AAE0ZXR7_9GAST|nr:hypothetical protein RRG08_037068 [Elysia crispata]
MPASKRSGLQKHHTGRPGEASPAPFSVRGPAFEGMPSARVSITQRHVTRPRLELRLLVRADCLCADEFDGLCVPLHRTDLSSEACSYGCRDTAGRQVFPVNLLLIPASFDCVAGFQPLYRLLSLDLERVQRSISNCHCRVSSKTSATRTGIGM